MFDTTQLADKLIKTMRALDEATTELEERTIEAAQCRHTYNLSKAKAFIKLEPKDVEGKSKTVQAKEAEVTLLCDHEQRECYLAEAMRDAVLERVRTLRCDLSAIQSVGAALRAEVGLAGAR